MKPFKDHFSKHAESYAQYRPGYPKELFDYLASLTNEHDLAWDCGTGNGQSAIQLTACYSRVYASDPSAQQIENAIVHPQIDYAVEPAEASSLDDASVDLITVAQAVHWFDFARFYPEVKRVLKDDGVIAVWAYGIPFVTPEMEPVIRRFHDETVGEFWQQENRLIEKEYITIPFPFEVIRTPEFQMSVQWNLHDLLGYFRTWSATQKYMDHYGVNPVEGLRTQLEKYWEDEYSTREVVSKLILKAGRK